MTRERRLGLALSLLGAGALAVLAPLMARRLEAHNQSADFQRFAFRPIDADRFEFLGLPAAVRLVPDAPAGPEVVIEWRGESLSIPAGGHVESRLPDYLAVSDWLRTLEIRPLVAGDEGVGPADEGSRLVVVARRPAPGADDQRFVNRKAWLYEFVEFRRPDAPPADPLPPPAPPRRPSADPAALPVSDFAQTDAFARWTINFAALPSYEREWQYPAALAVTPRLSYPRNRFTDDGLGALAWTWPAGGVAVLALVAGLGLLGASFVRREGRPSPR